MKLHQQPREKQISYFFFLTISAAQWQGVHPKAVVAKGLPGPAAKSTRLRRPVADASSSLASGKTGDTRAAIHDWQADILAEAGGHARSSSPEPRGTADTSGKHIYSKIGLASAASSSLRRPPASVDASGKRVSDHPSAKPSSFRPEGITDTSHESGKTIGHAATMPSSLRSAPEIADTSGKHKPVKIWPGLGIEKSESLKLGKIADSELWAKSDSELQLQIQKLRKMAALGKRNSSKIGLASARSDSPKLASAADTSGNLDSSKIRATNAKSDSRHRLQTLQARAKSTRLRRIASTSGQRTSEKVSLAGATENTDKDALAGAAENTVRFLGSDSRQRLHALRFAGSRKSRKKAVRHTPATLATEPKNAGSAGSVPRDVIADAENSLREVNMLNARPSDIPRADESDGPGEDVDDVIQRAEGTLHSRPALIQRSTARLRRAKDELQNVEEIPQNIWGVPKMVWVILADVLAMGIFLACTVLAAWADKMAQEKGWSSGPYPPDPLLLSARAPELTPSLGGNSLTPSFVNYKNGTGYYQPVQV
jgi:hypothetical protein